MTAPWLTGGHFNVGKFLRTEHYLPNIHLKVICYQTTEPWFLSTLIAVRRGPTNHFWVSVFLVEVSQSAWDCYTWVSPHVHLIYWWDWATCWLPYLEGWKNMDMHAEKSEMIGQCIISQWSNLDYLSTPIFDQTLVSNRSMMRLNHKG